MASCVRFNIHVKSQQRELVGCQSKVIEQAPVPFDQASIFDAADDKDGLDGEVLAWRPRASTTTSLYGILLASYAYIIACSRPASKLRRRVTRTHTAACLYKPPGRSRQRSSWRQPTVVWDYG